MRANWSHWSIFLLSYAHNRLLKKEKMKARKIWSLKTFSTPLVFRATNISSLSEKRVLCTFSRSFKRSFIAGVTHPSRCSKVSADVLETGGSASDVTETLDFSGHFSSFFALSVFFFLSLCFVRHFFVPRARGFAINNCCGRSAPCGRVCTFCFFFFCHNRISMYQPRKRTSSQFMSPENTLKIHAQEGKLQRGWKMQKWDTWRDLARFACWGCILPVEQTLRTAYKSDSRCLTLAWCPTPL